VGRRGLAATGIHQLFAILGLVGEVDEGQPVAGKVAEAEVGDVPLGGGRQRPAVAGEAGEGGAVGGVDLGTFHGVTTDRVAWLCRAAVQSSWWATASSGVAQPKRPSSLPARSARKAAQICMRMSGKPGSKMPPVMVLSGVPKPRSAAHQACSLPRV